LQSNYSGIVIDSTAANVAARFKDFLAKVQMGEVIRIHDEGRPVVRLTRDAEFMPGPAAARLFSAHAADPTAATAIARELQKLDAEAENALDH
jgi:antitoxin (DNA-binding transcriptional repressor) of toxin-antitoxin stability system